MNYEVGEGSGFGGFFTRRKLEDLPIEECKVRLIPVQSISLLPGRFSKDSLSLQSDQCLIRGMVGAIQIRLIALFATRPGVAVLIANFGLFVQLEYWSEVLIAIQ